MARSIGHSGSKPDAGPTTRAEILGICTRKPGSFQGRSGRCEEASVDRRIARAAKTNAGGTRGDDQRGADDSESARSDYAGLKGPTMLDDTAIEEAGVSGRGVAGLGLHRAELAAESAVCCKGKRPAGTIPGRRQSAASSRQSQARHLISIRPAGRRIWKLSTTSPKLREMHGKPMPESFTKGQQIAQLQGKPLNLFRAAARVQDVRQIRPADLRTVPAHRQRGRRRLHRALHVVRADQSRSGAHVHEYRLDHRRPPEHGFVAALRPGRGDRRSAGIRRDAVGGARRADAADLGAAMVGRISAEQISGRETQLRRRSGAVYRQSRRASTPSCSASRSMPSTRWIAMRYKTGAGSGNSHAHLAV